jgi:hypothetical protein
MDASTAEEFIFESVAIMILFWRVSNTSWRRFEVSEVNNARQWNIITKNLRVRHELRAAEAAVGSRK